MGKIKNYFKDQLFENYKIFDFIFTLLLFINIYIYRKLTFILNFAHKK